MKVGIIGGTFNPIHYAHLRIAEEVRERLALEQVLFIPAATPPHKPLTGDVTFAQRLAMVELAIADQPAFAVSDIEGKRSGKSYSIDTLREMRALHPADEFFFIIGSDSFLELGLWYQYAAIFASCHLVVVERPGARVTALDRALPPAVADEFQYYADERLLVHRSGHRVLYQTGIPLDISSSAIRGLARQKRSLRYLLPPAVEQYILEQRLYTDAD